MADADADAALSGKLIVLLGGGGFFGAHVAQELLARGARLRIACRKPKRAYRLKTLANLGQVQFLRADITNSAVLPALVAGADGVVNLVGAFKGDLKAAHVTGPAALAAAARAAGASAFVHLSAIGADPKSTSRYGRTKGEGEAAVRKAFPNATILRPSLVFGAEDQLTNRFAGLARLPLMPVIAPKTKFQPVFVGDVGQAVAKAALAPSTYGGKSFDLAGSEVMTMRAMIERIAAMAGRAPAYLDLPDAAASALASLGFLPGAPLTKDQWLMLQQDNVAATGSKGLEAFGLIPTALEAVAPDWLGRFVKGGRFRRRATDSKNA